MALYNVIYQFKDTLTGSYRLFDKDNQTITVMLSSQANTGGRSSDFTVLLQRRVLGVGYSTEGTASFPRNGMKEVTFTKLPSGPYRLKFEKSTDDIEIIGVGFFLVFRGNGAYTFLIFKSTFSRTNEHRS